MANFTKMYNGDENKNMRKRDKYISCSKCGNQLDTGFIEDLRVFVCSICCFSLGVMIGGKGKC
jgi:hypothetical protein